MLTIDIGTDETGGLSLTDPWRSSGDNSLGTGDVHNFEEEPCAEYRWDENREVRDEETKGPDGKNSQVLDDPLHDTKIVHHLHKCDEENDSRQLETGMVNF